MNSGGPTVGVTGANGFIGSQLTGRLIEEGYDVIPCARAKGPPLSGMGVDYTTVDVLDPRGLHDALGGADVVVHLAGITGISNCERRPEDAFRVNVQGTENVAWMCRNRNIPLVFSSSVAVIGQPTANIVAPDHSRQPMSLYGLTKAMNEEDIERLSSGRFPAYVMRLANVFGSYPSEAVSHVSVVDIFLAQAIDDGRVTVHEPGTQKRDFIYVDDAVSALARAVTRIRSADDGSRILQVGTGTSRSILDVAEAVRDLVRNHHGTDPVVDLVETDEDADILEDFAVDTTATVEELSFRPRRDLEAGIADVLGREAERAHDAGSGRPPG